MATLLSSPPRRGDSDRLTPDPFADTRMSFGDHLEALRRHLWRALLGFGVALAGSFFVSPWLLELLGTPVEQELTKFYDRRLERVQQRLRDGDVRLREANQPREVTVRLHRKHLADALGLQDPGGPEWIELPIQLRPIEITVALDEAERQVSRPPSLKALTVTEPFLVYFKVSVYCGLVLSSPWVFYQLWAFVAAGLYPHERRYVHFFLPVSVVLFLAGVALCQFVVLPWTVEYLLTFHEWLGLEPELRLSDWLTFAVSMPLVFGALFQTPVVMLFLNRLGFVDVAAYRRHRRLAIFLLAVLAAVLSASPDYYSMLALAVPLWLLYEVGILLCHVAPRPAFEGEPAAEP